MVNLDILSVIITFIILYRASRVNRLKYIEGMYTCISSFIVFMLFDILYYLFDGNLIAQFYMRLSSVTSLLLSFWSIYKWDYKVYCKDNRYSSFAWKYKSLLNLPILLYIILYLGVLVYSVKEIINTGTLINTLNIQCFKFNNWYTIVTFSVLHFYLLLSGLLKRETSTAYGGIIIDKNLTLIEYPGIPFICSLLSLYFDFNVISAGILISAIVLYMRGMESVVSLDSLTGVNNRGSFLAYIKSQMKLFNDGKSENLYLMMLDLDKFKKINDTYGHVEGDNALRIVSSILKDGCRRLGLGAGVQLSRFGGDEFCVVFSNIKEPKKIEDYIRYIYASLTKENVHLRYNLGISIGVSSYEKGQTLEQFIEKSDKCLYKVKENHHKNG